MIHYKGEYAKINTHDLDKHISQAGFFNKMPSDIYFYVVLISIGMSGLYFTCNSKHASINKTHEIPVAVENYPIPDAPPPTETKQQVLPHDESSPRALLQISGHREAGEKITFTIDSFDEEATYKLYPGNGQAININNKHTNYVYAASGTFNVRLHISYKDYEDTVIYNQSLTIYKAIEVIGDINEPDFE